MSHHSEYTGVKLTHKQLEMHGCVLSTVPTDAIVQRHQIISIHNADWIFIVFGQFHTDKYSIYREQKIIGIENKIIFWNKKYPVV